MVHFLGRCIANVVRRIARDTRGNTLVIVGAALVPLTALIGSGLDMSRGYMAQERLQQACDAGALAGRRAMTNGVVDAAVQTEALKFFKFNFPIGTDGVDGTAAFGAKGFIPVVDDAPDNATTVVITASTTIPTSVMKMFGFTTLPLTVSCNAKQDFVNTDIMLVLDTTGSMAQKAVFTDTDTKIVALRKAVLALYDQLAPVQTQLEAAGLRMRYGIVPYASSVNVGKLIKAVNSSYIVSDTWTYQSRIANYNTAVYTGTAGTPTTSTQTYSSSISSSNCVKYGANQSFSGSSGLPSATSDGATAPSPTTAYAYTALDWGGSTTISGSGTKTCRRTRTATTSTYTTRYQFTNWTYGPSSYDVSAYVGSTVSIANGNSISSSSVPNQGSYNLRELTALADTQGLDTTSVTWAGCIEHRQTVNTITSSTTTIPTGAKDLTVDLIPTSDKTTKWAPYWPDVEYQGNGGKPQVACPAEAKRLQAWARADLSTYLNTLNPDGGTYHDNGIIWGATLLSSAGIFSADNPSTYNNMPVSKFIIFMTDGLLDTGYDTLYTTYGIEKYDARVTPGGSASDENDQASRHRQRFNLMCAATRNMGVSIWVVAFASTLDTDLTNCASNTSQASTSANSAQLNAKFVEIGKNIGSLRLTQ